MQKRTNLQEKALYKWTILVKFERSDHIQQMFNCVLHMIRAPG